MRNTVQAEGKTGTLLLIVQGIFLVFTVSFYLFSFGGTWLSLPLPSRLRWVGAVLGFLSLPFLALVHYTPDKHWDISVSLTKDHKLVTTGSYHRIRHPMYTVPIVYFLSWVLVSPNLLLRINYLLTLLLIALRIPKEERMLLARFGKEYRVYMKRTGRLLPSLHHKNEKETP